MDATLTRMGMDYLDIYYLHREDHKVPLEETVQAIGDLLRQGKIRYWGCPISVVGALPRSAMLPSASVCPGR